MFSKIVVGTDGSDTAAGAVALAVDLARQSGATLHVGLGLQGRHHLDHGGARRSGCGSRHHPHGVRVESASEEMLAEVVKDTGGVEFHTHAVPGLPADVLISVAESVGADVIIVGSKGMKGARRLIGSVPNTVAHRSPCHVIIAKTYLRSPPQSPRSRLVCEDPPGGRAGEIGFVEAEDPTRLEAEAGVLGEEVHSDVGPVLRVDLSGEALDRLVLHHQVHHSFDDHRLQGVVGCDDGVGIGGDVSGLPRLRARAEPRRALLHTPHTGMTWGRPSGRTVATQ